MVVDREELERAGKAFLSKKKQHKPPGTYRCQKCDAPVNGELHACPYDEDLHGDYTPTCNCCEACADLCCAEL